MKFFNLLYFLFLKLGIIINIFFKKSKIEKKKEFISLTEDFKKKGYLIINNFLKKEECNFLCQEIDKFHKNYSRLVWSDKLGAEIRIFGAEKINKNFESYFTNDFISNLGSQIFNGKLENLMVMANRIEAKTNNEGSGSGWHRDAFDFQYKSILYLSDTEEDNGPFQIIEKSENFFNIIIDTFKYSLDIRSSRFSDSQIQTIINCEPKRLKTFRGKAGTLLIVNTSSIHRGKPLKYNTRYALTNYFYPDYKVNSMRSHFTPMLDKKPQF